MSFGINVPATTDVDPVALARQAESLGYDFVSAADHPCGASPTRETWTMLTWIAANTSRIRVATRVLGVPYRPPAMVAKMAETLDRLSGGRLILGLGGGYSDEEFRAFGLTVPTPRDKVDGLDEAITIMHGLWSKQAFSFGGRLYQTDSADLEPKPEHHIPIWLGTFGDRALRVTGRRADGWIPSAGYVPDDELLVMHRKVLTAAAEAGRDPAEITCALNLGVAADHTAAQVAGRVARFLAAGFTAINFMPSGPSLPDQVHRIAAELIPVLGSQFRMQRLFGAEWLAAPGGAFPAAARHRRFAALSGAACGHRRA